jgi:hypothetical protein
LIVRLTQHKNEKPDHYNFITWASCDLATIEIGSIVFKRLYPGNRGEPRVGVKSEMKVAFLFSTS